MNKIRNYSALKYLLVLSLSVALLLSQTGQQHMHFEHADHSGSSVHVVAAHPKSTLHDFDVTNHHGEHLSDHSAVAVDISPDKLLKNASFLNLFAVILLFIGPLLCAPRRTSVSRQKFYKSLFSFCYYLFRPPLRAPPVN